MMSCSFKVWERYLDDAEKAGVCLQFTVKTIRPRKQEGYKSNSSTWQTDRRYTKYCQPTTQAWPRTNTSFDDVVHVFDDVKPNNDDVAS